MRDALKEKKGRPQRRRYLCVHNYQASVIQGSTVVRKGLHNICDGIKELKAIGQQQETHMCCITNGLIIIICSIIRSITHSDELPKVIACCDKG